MTTEFGFVGDDHFSGDGDDDFEDYSDDTDDDGGDENDDYNAGGDDSDGGDGVGGCKERSGLRRMEGHGCGHLQTLL